jgi:hypothetical protein
MNSDTLTSESFTLTDVLEILVDSNGLAEVLESLSEVCFLKWEHLTSAWQDVAAGDEWQADARRIQHIAARTVNRNRRVIAK